MIKALKIKIKEIGSDGDKVKVTIPLKALEIIEKLTPKRIQDELAAEGISLSDVLEASKSIEEPGTLMEIETEDKEIKITLE